MEVFLRRSHEGGLLRNEHSTAHVACVYTSSNLKTLFERKDKFKKG